MIPEDERPEIQDQEMPPWGVWRAGNPMQWEPAENSDPVGPLLPQEHAEGMWLPGPGGFMTWIDAVPVEQNPVLIIVPGDEQQQSEDEDEDDE